MKRYIKNGNSTKSNSAETKATQLVNDIGSSRRLTESQISRLFGIRERYDDVERLKEMLIRDHSIKITDRNISELLKSGSGRVLQTFREERGEDLTNYFIRFGNDDDAENSPSVDMSYKGKAKKEMHKNSRPKI